MLHFIHKNLARVLSVKSDSSICRSHDYCSSNWHVTWQAGANGEWPLSWHHYRDIIMMTSFILPLPRLRIHKTIGVTRLLPSIYTFFGLIFQKPLTCIRNDIQVVSEKIIQFSIFNCGKSKQSTAITLWWPKHNFPVCKKIFKWHHSRLCLLRRARFRAPSRV